MVEFARARVYARALPHRAHVGGVLALRSCGHHLSLNSLPWGRQTEAPPGQVDSGVNVCSAARRRPFWAVQHRLAWIQGTERTRNGWRGDALLARRGPVRARFAELHAG